MNTMDNIPTIEEVISLLGVSEQHILNVYPYGSHLYGLARPDSDWDMIVVLDDFVGPLQKSATHPDATLPGFEEGFVRNDKIDITVYHKSYWQKLLYNNIVRILLVTAIPKQFVLKEVLPLEFKLNYMRMKHGLYFYMKMRERIALRFWQKGHKWLGQKQLLHVLRVLEVSQQIIDTGQIQDYCTANHYWKELKDADFQSWDQAFAWYLSKRNPLYEPLKVHLNVYKEVLRDLPKVRPLRVLDYLEDRANNNFETLERETSIKATFIEYPTCLSENPPSKLEKFVILERLWESPRHDALHQSYRLILKSTSDPHNKWKVVGLAPRKYWAYGADDYTSPDEKFVPKIDCSATKVFEKMQGVGVLVFWDQDSQTWNAVFGTSGFFASQFAVHHNIEQSLIGNVLYDEFRRLWTEKSYCVPKVDPNASLKTYNFIFHPYEKHLKLESIVDLSSFEEIYDFDDIGKQYGWDVVTQINVKFPFTNPKNDINYKKNMEALKLAALSSKLPLLSHEGYVCLDSKLNRIEFASPQYDCLQSLWSIYERRYRTRNFLKIVRATLAEPEGQSKFNLYYPEWASWYNYTALVFRRMCATIDSGYALVKDIKDSLAFTAEMKKCPFSSSKIFWKLRQSGQDAFTFFTDPINLNEGPATQAIITFSEDHRVFDEVNQPDEEEN